MKKQKIQNIINWTAEEKPKFLFDRDVISVKGQPDEYDFSMVIAVYNAEKYVGETIESIIAQDYGFEKIQIILVDDGAKDGSFEVCKKYAEQYPENIILVHKENGGVSSARNVGMRFVKGKYINFIDSDDLLSKNVCTQVFNFFKKYEKKTDVVCFKVELFGAKKGDNWFNKKFKKGDRLIDLWKEPQVFLNSVSFTFFHSRIKNQLAFDEELCISEDLKVVNTVLMNRWTLGVLSSCTYYYRMHTADEASLSSSARMKDNWYFTYLDRVFMWLYKKSLAQASCFPEYLQYTLYRDLFNRFNENKQCVKVLQPEQIAEYKQKLFEALKLIDDKVIRNIDVINTDYQVYFYSIKYGSPKISVDGDFVHFIWEDAGLDISKRLSVMYENCEIKNKTLTLEGYVIWNNVGINFKENSLKFEIDGLGEVSPEVYKNTTNNKLAFADEYVFFRKYFRLKVPTSKIKNSTINAYVKFGKLKIPFAYGGNGKWFGVSANTPCSYYYQNGSILTFENRKLNIQKACCCKKNKFERKFLKYLKQNGENSAEHKKAFYIRILHKVLRLLKIRPIWIVSDRRISGGDNGEAFYKFLKKKWWINKYFAISPSSPDWKRLKKMGFKVIDPFSRKFRFKFLVADKIVSSHFEDDQLMPISNKFIPDIIQKKKHVFLQHGIIKDDLSAVYSRKNQKLDIFVTSAKPEYDSIVETPMYFCDESVAKLTGLPRYDKLYNDDKKIILVIPTWRRGLCDHMDHTTGQWVLKSNFKNSYYCKFYTELFENKELKEKLAEKGYQIYYFPHTNMIAANEHFKNIEGVHLVEGSERNYTKLFAESSIMVTDYSSTAFDFGYLRKPIIFCQGDSEEFFGSHTYTKGYFDYERDAFGKILTNASETAKEIIKLIENDCKLDEKYLDRINKFFPYSDKNNSKRVYHEIKKL